MTSVEDLVLVAGATGGVGQLVVGKLLEKGFKVRILTRNAAKATKMFNNRVEIAVGDIREATTLPAAMPDVAAIICCTGTTAFPSARWEFDPSLNVIEWGIAFVDRKFSEAKAKNSPAKVDGQGVSNLVAAAPGNLKRFVFVSSCGILRKDQLPWSILNGFGVLDAKQQGENAIATSGLPYTIIRPGRLIDGPYTSYDLNTLLKAKTGGKFGVVVGTGDTLQGDSSRIDVAAACVESLFYPSASGQVFELVNQGTRPTVIDWEKLFSQLERT
ncbi:putative nucleoside-diphosphate sugar epimerase [Cylindrospermum stagnale PCC 7417]|uniref:Putative nucleoside-diphosphate sugar epimerase n=1 Tax=Cylindrospermum stagnale PCC 7417 TaxID=56107 RepID=K9WXU6_9NOST|nr:SDR family oxidoreductase [Cylindrospermum stagnale]AFZ24634.1 putative nucleoside-diphosphate sugar epimerase [Cylindrospermum stagnale PCC 7417]